MSLWLYIFNFYSQELDLSHNGEAGHTTVLDQKPGIESQQCHWSANLPNLSALPIIHSH